VNLFSNVIFFLFGETGEILLELFLLLFKEILAGDYYIKLGLKVFGDFDI